MSSNLVIVESPAKAKTIGKYLGSDFVVRASMGHVVDLPLNDLGVDIEKGYKPKYMVASDKKKIVSDLKKAAQEVDMIWLATDEDREGEAIAWHIMNTLKIKDNDYERIVFHEITKDAIQKAIKEPRKINTELVDAQQARRIIDRLVGYKLSPMLWKKVRKGLSAGRVQSVAVRFIVEREEEIKNFVPEESWKINGITATSDKKTITVVLLKAHGKKINVSHEDEVRQLLNKEFGDLTYEEKEQKNGNKELQCKLAPAEPLIVTNVKTKTVKRTPPPPFITSTLQQEASRRYGYSVSYTMRLAQKLYEGIDLDHGRVGLITYMRTDSYNLAQDSLNQIQSFIHGTFGQNYAKKGFRRYKTKSKGAQEAHEAIRPVDVSLTPDRLKGQLDAALLKLYTLIWRRTVATQMEDAIYEQTDIECKPENKPLLFGASGKVLKFDGYTKLYKDGDDENGNEDEPILPAVSEGDRLNLKLLQLLQNFTKPPTRYTEATLVRKLESEGIGRPSTYAPTISTIINRGYVGKEKKYLFPTDIAGIVNKFLCQYFADIVDYKFTARIEKGFDDIAAGSVKWENLVDEFYKPFEQKIAETDQKAKKYMEETDRECPQCGQKLVIRMSRYGRFYSCSNFPECKYTESLEKGENRQTDEPVLLEEKCPDCGEPLSERKGRYGKFIACSSYPKCKYVKKQKKIVKEKGCPKCGGNVIEKRSRRGKTFFGCDQYPKCDYAVWKKEDIK